MKLNIKSIFRISILFLGLITLPTFAQQWGIVEKSTLTKQVGNQVFYLHTVVKGNTLFSLAKTYNVSVNEIKAANFGLSNDLKLGAVLLIPKDYKSESAAPSASIATDKYFYHVVKQGESISIIAKIYGVKAVDLVKINNLNQQSISPGLYLKIPEVELESIDLQQKTKNQQITDINSKYFEHVVQPKETLFSIAKRYGIGLETLKYINNFTTNTIYIGQVILLPKALKDFQTQESKQYITHLVQPKEGLYGIARKYGVTIEQIEAINQDLSTNLFIGQELKIPRSINSKGYIEHQVSDRKEKLSNIARDYEVSLSNLKDINPGAPSKVKRGETVYIPIDFVDKAEDDLEIEFPEEEKPIKVDPFFYKLNKDHVFNIALMLPLYLSDVDSLLNVDPQKLITNRQDIRSFRFLEFYEGAQIAVDSLRKMGMKLNFQVYDVTNNELETALLLQDKSLSEMDLIISLLYSKSFALVSNFSEENHIPLVNALSKRGQIVYNNPYVFKISPKPEALYYRVADFIGKNLSTYNTIIVRNNPYQFTNEYNLIAGLLKNKIDSKAPISNAFALQKISTYMEGRQGTYLDTLHRVLEKKEYSFVLNNIINKPYDSSWVNNPIKTVIYSADSLRGIMKAVSLFRNNLILALGSDEVFAIELFTKLNFVRNSIKINVIGLPDWQNFDKVDVSYSQPFSLRVVSETFVDYNSPYVMSFVDKFQRKYNKAPEIETYSFLGYDATFYFLQALFRFGDDLLREIPNFQIPLLQNQMHFEKQNRGGFENIYWNIYRQEDYQYKIEQ